MTVLCESGESSGGAAVTVATAISVNTRNKQTQIMHAAMHAQTDRCTTTCQLVKLQDLQLTPDPVAPHL